MNIQIFGKPKCFDTQKAQRYFKERRIPFQYIDLRKKGLSPGELRSVSAALGGLEGILDEIHPYAALLRSLAPPEAKVEKVLDNPLLLKTPIVRNGKSAALGFCPEVWEQWK
jgi:arsenate reductase-like glutaredoxin family protein